MKNLVDYITDKSQRLRLALALDCTPEYLQMIARGDKRAGPAMAQRIEKFTKGKVQKSELRPDLWSKRP